MTKRRQVFQVWKRYVYDYNYMLRFVHWIYEVNVSNTVF